MKLAFPFAVVSGILLSGFFTLQSAGANPPVSLQKVGALGGLAGAEISAYDPASMRMFVTSDSGLEIVDMSDPENPAVVAAIDPATNGATDSAVTSVAVSGGLVAAGVPGSNEQAPGEVYFYDAATAAFINKVVVGALPDMVTFTPDGNTVLVANEGEPNFPENSGIDIEVTEIWPGQTGDDLTADWFEIVNRGDTTWTQGVDPDLFYDDDSADPGVADPITGLTSLAPGETAIVVVSDTAGDVADFVSNWMPDITLDDVEVGIVDGSGLSNTAADAVTIWLGDPGSGGTLEDSAPYPGVSGGASFDIDLNELSTVDNVHGAVATTATAGSSGMEPATGSPGIQSDDPVGSVSVIDVSGGAAAAMVSTVSFSGSFNQESALRTAGVRIFPGRSAPEDFEPEYITVTPDGMTAFVALQENNALAKIDLVAETVEILPLGLKDHSVAGNEMDASDDDGDTFNLDTYPVFGMYMPDAIAAFSANGSNYVITANEGDARDEDSRIKDITLDPTAFPDAAALQDDAVLGRLEISLIDGDADQDSDFDELFSYGARSFSILDSTGAQVFDSGAQLAELTNAEGIYPESRSDAKGTEPEGVVVGEVNGTILAFIGLERASAVVVYNVTNPAAPVFQDIVFDAADVAPEGLIFIAAADNATGSPLLVVSSEESSTVAVYEIGIAAQPDISYRKKGKSGPVAGGGLYSSNGGNQVLRGKKVKKKAIVKFAVENDGTAEANIQVRAFKLPRRKFRLKYLRTAPTRANVTAALKRGGSIQTLEGGATARYQGTFRKKARKALKFTKRITATNSAEGLRDVIKYKQKFRR